MAKSTCPVTRAEFRRDAQPVEVTINGIPMTAEVSVQIGMNLTIVGSKELPK